VTVSIPGDAMTALACGIPPEQVLAAVRSARAKQDAADRAWCEANGWEFKWVDWTEEDPFATAEAALAAGEISIDTSADEPSAADRYLASLAARRGRCALIDMSVNAWALSRPAAPARLARPSSVAPGVWQACVHEAAHAVAAVALRMELRSVFASDEGRGTTECTPSASPLANAVMLLAGAEGESLFTAGGPFPLSGSDLQLLNEQNIEPAAVARARDAARHILAANAPAVGRVARRLTESFQLTGAQVAEAAGELVRTPAD